MTKEKWQRFLMDSDTQLDKLDFLMQAMIKGIASGIWFFTYKFVVWPMFIVYLFLIMLTVAILAVLYR